MSNLTFEVFNLLSMLTTTSTKMHSSAALNERCGVAKWEIMDRRQVSVDAVHRSYYHHWQGNVSSTERRQQAIIVNYCRTASLTTPKTSVACDANYCKSIPVCCTQL